VAEAEADEPAEAAEHGGGHDAEAAQGGEPREAAEHDDVPQEGRPCNGLGAGHWPQT